MSEQLEKMKTLRDNMNKFLDNLEHRIDRFDEEDVDAVESPRFTQLFELVEHNQHID